MLDRAQGQSPPCVEETVLAAFIDGELPPDERAEVEAHLAACAECFEVSSDAIRTLEEARRREFIRACVRAALIVAVLGTLAAGCYYSLFLR